MSEFDDYGLERSRPRKSGGLKGRSGKKRAPQVLWWRAIVLAFAGLWLIGGAFKYGAIIYRQGWRVALFGKAIAPVDVKWEEFVHQSGLFRVEMPGIVRQLPAAHPPQIAHLASSKSFDCMVRYEVIPPQAVARVSAGQLLEEGTQLLYPDFPTTSMEPIEYAGLPGRESRRSIRFEGKSATIVTRAFFLPARRAFIALEFIYQQADEPVAARERFFNSLRFDPIPSEAPAGFPVAGTAPAGFPESPAKSASAGASKAVPTFDTPPAGAASGTSGMGGDTESPFKAKATGDSASTESPFQPKSKSAPDQGASPFKAKEETPFKPKDESPFKAKAETKTADGASPFQPKGKSASAGSSSAAGAKKPAPTREKQTPILGGSGGQEFRTVGSGGPVVGFQFDTGQWLREEVIRRFEPVYAGGRKPFGSVQVETARDGYAVGALEIDANKLVNAVRVIYMRVGDDGLLDPNDSYQSDWLGKPTGRKPRLLTGNGRPVIGIHGRRLAMLDAVGLVFE